MKRCIETAYILYPGSEYIVCDDFKECDFGDFEYKNYDELKENKDYQKFIDTMGQSGFPNGESRAVFQKRCVREFEKLVSSETEDFAVVAHGGTIMAVLDEFSKPHKDYYDWQCKNTEGFSAVYENGRLTDIKEI
jgi:alpha-ribazole phosphatase